MYRTERFKDYFINRVGAKQSSYNTYNSYLNRIDRAIGGLDEAIASRGIEAVLAWGQTATDGPFETYPSHARSVLKRYMQFVLDDEAPDEVEPDLDVLDEAVEATGTVFRLEREMQAAVRRQLSALEAGLKEIDGGQEVSVATGRIDILAESGDGDLVVIELKAGRCPSGAMEQALGYAEAISEERSKPARAILVASEFPDRVRAAAKRTVGLKLCTYEFSMRFSEVS